MASPKFPEPQLQVEATPIAKLDTILEKLASRADAWVATPIPRRIELLREAIAATVAGAAHWAADGARAKGVDPSSTRAGEEWLGGPMTVVRNMRLLIETLESGGQPQLPQVTTRPNGQKVARVFPTNTLDKLMYADITADVWIEPGKDATVGELYRDKAAGRKPTGKVALVLGAGNVSSIGPMDALYKLFADDEVVLIKTNPVNAYLGKHWEVSLAPFIRDGFLEIVHGGAEVGQHLTNHPKVSSIHITGSDRTHDVIVWGADPEEQKRRKEAGTPINTRPITSELGCVTPVLIVPGPWSEADIDFQARHVAAMVTNNASFNCNAAKVVVVASGWDLKEKFLAAVREKLAAVPARKAYYPGAQQRYQGFVSHYPDAKALGPASADVVPWTVLPHVAAEQGEYALTNEAFCGVLAEVELQANDAGEFLAKAAAFANDDCWGTLSMMMLIHPKSEQQYAAAYDKAIAELKYGGIGVNVWAGVIYGLCTPPWGAFPGHPLEDIRSGRGWVHNTFLLDHPQKTVLKAPFRIAPTPAWFSDHKTQNKLGEALVSFEAAPSFLRLPKVLAAALRG